MTRPDAITLPQSLVDAHMRLMTGADLGKRHLRLLARHFHETGDMQRYCALFAKADPALRRHFRESCRDAAFMRTTGKVPGAVNIFRRLQYKSDAGSVPVFEKIYHRRALDL